ncbi:unnamed protein product [Rotaria sordida]|nr:unnamed protein product [Rotaria sordida]
MVLFLFIRLFTVISNIPLNVRWSRSGVTVAGGHGGGNTTDQLQYPYGLYLDNEQTIIIVDHENHRIVQWIINEANGQVVAGGNGRGNRLDQLNYPTDVLVDKETDNLIIADFHNRRIVR